MILGKYLPHSRYSYLRGVHVEEDYLISRLERIWEENPTQKQANLKNRERLLELDMTSGFWKRRMSLLVHVMQRVYIIVISKVFLLDASVVKWYDNTLALFMQVAALFFFLLFLADIVTVYSGNMWLHDVTNLYSATDSQFREMLRYGTVPIVLWMNGLSSVPEAEITAVSYKSPTISWYCLNAWTQHYIRDTYIRQQGQLQMVYKQQMVKNSLILIASLCMCSMFLSEIPHSLNIIFYMPLALAFVEELISGLESIWPSYYKSSLIYRLLSILTVSYDDIVSALAQEGTPMLIKIEYW